jgi:Ternary complex associated domain 9/Clp amino terminal domain, pathogenicity island component
MTIDLKDILISARQESHRMQHFYIGVEHLFIALLEIPSGIARSIVQEHGLTPEYVIDGVRQKIGKGSKRRIWSGTPSTPRANVILAIANEIAMDEGRADINERDLLTAIFEEGENMPVRVLKRLGLDIPSLINEAQYRSVERVAAQPYINIDYAPEFDTRSLTDEHMVILLRMFYGYAGIRLESRLTGGYTKALVLVVTPLNADGREDAAVVVKIDDTDEILDEAQRYETHVKGTLPPLTARLEDKPVAPEICALAGVKYTIVTKPDKTPQDLGSAIAEMGADKLGYWLRQQLYTQFGRTWWQQRRTFRFQVWTEYDWILPPILTMQYIPETEASTSGHMVRVPVNRSKLKQIESGNIVTLENFTVQRVYPEQGAIQLAIGRGNEATRRAYKIILNGIDLDKDFHYRGEVIDRIVGRVRKTRHESLMNAAMLLDAPFDLNAETITINTIKPRTLPNPIVAYEELLHLHISGSTSKIHGDLHLGNILVGPGDSPFLIDFAHSRDGHTIFDWATLETSLLSDWIMKQVGSDWEAAYLVLDYMAALNAQTTFPRMNPELTLAFTPLIAIRSIAQETLANESAWEEYYISLALSALRGIVWETKSIGGRRLLFLVAALAIEEAQKLIGEPGEMDTPMPDEQDATEYQ